MDRLSLNSYIPFVSSVGATLPAFQIATISTSLSSLVKTARLHDIQFFGRIDGATGDYLLAVSHEVDLFAPRKVFCSVDEGLSWAQLPSPVADAVLAEKILKLQTPFTGSLAQESVIDHEETVVPESSPVPEKVESPVAEEEKTGEEEEEEEEEEEKEAEAEEEEEEDVDDDDMKGKVVISEEVRLSTVVLHITQQYGLVPRGGCILNSEHFVLKNRLFRGLEPEEAEKWGSYLHFRNAEVLAKKSLLELEGLSETHDFLDPISEDVPKGTWSVRLDKSTGRVVVMSLVWPGAMAFHQVCTPMFGNAYFGTGLCNLDIAFAL